MSQIFALPMPEWTDREAVAEFAATRAGILGDDPAAARAIARRIWDRTPGTASSVQMANQLGMMFSKLDCTPRWRERLAEIETPTLVIHGRHDMFFPSQTARRSPDRSREARLLVLEDAARAVPISAVEEIAAAMLGLTR